MPRPTNVPVTQNVIRNDEIPENFNVGRFLFTKKTITYDGKTVQLSNVTRISKYNFKETHKPIFRITPELMRQAGIALLVSFLAAWFLNGYDIIVNIATLVILGALSILGYAWYERSTKKPKDYRFYGLIIETSSGKAENLLTQNQQFIDTLFHEITRAMNDVDFKTIVANFNDHHIQYIDNKHVENVLGDKFQDISGSKIINRSGNGNDIDLEELIREM